MFSNFLEFSTSNISNIKILTLGESFLLSRMTVLRKEMCLKLKMWAQEWVYLQFDDLELSILKPLLFPHEIFEMEISFLSKIKTG